jgi:hypothetical protein
VTSGRHIGPFLQISREGRVPHIVYGAEIRGIRRSASRSVGKSGRCASEPVIERWQCFKRIRSTGTGSVVTTSTSGFFRSSCPRLGRTTQGSGLAIKSGGVESPRSRAADCYRSPGKKPLAIGVCTGVPSSGILDFGLCTCPEQPEELR